MLNARLIGEEMFAGFFIGDHYNALSTWFIDRWKCIKTHKHETGKNILSGQYIKI